MTAMHRVLVANPGEEVEVRNIPADLESMQAVVDGYIELWAIEDHVHFVCNDEGRINGMPFNRYVDLSDGTVWAIYGPILVIGGNEETGEFESLTDADIARWKPRLDAARLLTWLPNPS